MLYQIETREKAYTDTVFNKNVLNMDEKKFSAFLRAIRISTDYDGEFIFEFNSGLRHKYCLVVTITKGTSVLYDKGTGYMSKVFAERVNNILSEKNKTKA